MIMFLGFVAPADIAVHALYKPVPAIHGHAPAVGGGLLPGFGDVGTGGFEGLTFATSRQGYRRFQIVQAEPVAPAAPYAPYADLMEDVKAGFGRTMSHLAAVFGVSRQTLYNWLSGEVPKEKHRDKLVQLAAAARVFIEAGFKPTPPTLERTVARGKSLIELLGEGADGREMAQKLVQIVQRGTAAREKLDAMLGNRKAPRLDISDMGRPSLADDA
jgi:transcriptional regulator with XRE-family HTH domain